MTDEHKKRIGEANKRGKMFDCLRCGKPFYASPWEQKRKHPKKYCGRDCFREYYREHHAKKGKQNRFWKNGGLSYTKKKCLKRDKYTCVKCGFSDKRIMQVDHIKERSRGGSDDLDNLQTLCPNCHAIKTYAFTRKKSVV